VSLKLLQLDNRRRWIALSTSGGWSENSKRIGASAALSSSHHGLAPHGQPNEFGEKNRMIQLRDENMHECLTFDVAISKF
jgi:hypothetical protein